jgi:hypothetical protein
VQGLLDERWSDWFCGLTVVGAGPGDSPPETILAGAIDQAALRGILNKMWDLNMTLISIVPCEAKDSGSSEGGRL